MSKEIKCPICQGVSTLRYNENRTYMSHCHDINCFKLVTVTAPSEAVAEELFSKFEKGMSQPKLSIPKKIAEEVDEFAHANWANWQFYFYSDEMSEDLIDWLDNGDSEFTNAKIALAYLNPLTRPFVEVTDE